MKLRLFHRWACPYSAKVRDFINAHQLTDQISLLEIDELPEARDFLMEQTGKEQIPCLMIDGRSLFESQAIIRWLDQNLVGPQAQPTL